MIAGSMLLWPAAGAAEDAENMDGIANDAIWQDVWRAGYGQFARLRDSSRGSRVRLRVVEGGCQRSNPPPQRHQLYALHFDADAALRRIHKHIARKLHDILRRRIDVAHQFLHCGAAQRAHLQRLIAHLRKKVGIAHGGVEGFA